MEDVSVHREPAPLGGKDNTMFETIDEEMRKEVDRKTTYVKIGLFVAALCVLGVVAYLLAVGTH
jgi:hypothetical protein